MQRDTWCELQRYGDLSGWLPTMVVDAPGRCRVGSSGLHYLTPTHRDFVPAGKANVAIFERWIEPVRCQWPFVLAGSV